MILSPSKDEHEQRISAGSTDMEITKANESLKAAERCYTEGLYNSAVSRAYYSMYQAAQAALEAAGLKRAEWTHGGLQATFANELIRRQGFIPPRVTRQGVKLKAETPPASGAAAASECSALHRRPGLLPLR